MCTVGELNLIKLKIDKDTLWTKIMLVNKLQKACLSARMSIQSKA